MSKVNLRNQKGLSRRVKAGFTLIELLVVIGILAVLMAIVLIAINPARQFAQANNTKRRADINAILNAVGQYGADHKGAVPTGMAAGTTYRISGVVDAANFDLCTFVLPTYLSSLPMDPGLANSAAIQACSLTYDTGYSIAYGSATDPTNRRVTVAVIPAVCGTDCSTDLVPPDGVISVTR